MHLKSPKLFTALALAWLAFVPGTWAQATATLTTLHKFTDLSGVTNVDGSDPNAALILGSDGNFYGTTLYGFNGVGGIFKMTPDGTVTPVYGFEFNLLNASPSPDGAHPTGSLVEGPDGNFYGTTAQNGMHGAGTVFKVTPAGVLTTLFHFGTSDSNGNIPDGGTPAAGLILGNDGNFYGTTPAFNSGRGTIFKITPDGTLTTLHSFASSEPFSPKGQLCLGADGNFYGVGSAGGMSGNGGIFQMTPAGTVTILYLFTGPDGSSPVAGLTQGTDGKFYGTTTGGTGAALEGTIFSITGTGAFQTLHFFSADAGDPGNAFGRLVQGTDGNFYGTTFTSATVYQMTPAGVVTYLYTFPDSNPRAGLIQTSDGSFYGTTTDDLNYNSPPNGTVFKLSVSGVGAALPTVTLSAPVPTVTAGSGQAGEFLFTISSAPTAGNVKVAYQIKGNAVNGTDYETISGVVKFKPGKPTSKTVSIVPLGDGDGGASKKVKLALEPGTGYTVGTTDKIKIKIVSPSN